MPKNITYKHQKQEYDHIDDIDIIFIEEEEDDYVGYHPGIINHEIIDNTEVGITPYGPVLKQPFNNKYD